MDGRRKSPVPFELPADLRRGRDFVEWVRKTVPEDLTPFTKRRYPANARVRRICYFVLRELFGLGVAHTGRLMGVDHTSVLYGLKVITEEEKKHARTIEREFASQRKDG